jgi:shikimate kinase/3-dehydroquinate synthase
MERSALALVLTGDDRVLRDQAASLLASAAGTGVPRLALNQGEAAEVLLGAGPDRVLSLDTSCVPVEARSFGHTLVTVDDGSGAASGLRLGAKAAITTPLGPDDALALLRALRALRKAPAGAQLLWASAASGSHPVFIGEYLVRQETGGLWDLWPFDTDASRPFCLGDEAVSSQGLPLLERMASILPITPGEESKTLAQAEAVWRRLAQEGMTRADHVVALGGGVVGDLAGFCAACYQRGVPVVQIPTTLVSQTDSAYGGKTGVDLPGAKNYVGAYHQPSAVIVDPSLLRTLPPRELAAGWGEVVRTALISGGWLWDEVASCRPLGQGLVAACALKKLALVAADERDGSERMKLNLGHTTGHAIEVVTGFRRYRHGEAVALGLLVALRLSGLDDLRIQAREILAAHGLPTEAPGLDAEEVVRATLADKKRLRGSVPFVLLRSLGDAQTGCEVSGAELVAAIREVIAGR